MATGGAGFFYGSAGSGSGTPTFGLVQSLFGATLTDTASRTQGATGFNTSTGLWTIERSAVDTDANGYNEEMARWDIPIGGPSASGLHPDWDPQNELLVVHMEIASLFPGNTRDTVGVALVDHTTTGSREGNGFGYYKTANPVVSTYTKTGNSSGATTVSGLSGILGFFKVNQDNRVNLSTEWTTGSTWQTNGDTGLHSPGDQMTDDSGTIQWYLSVMCGHSSIGTPVAGDTTTFKLYTTTVELPARP